jgi:predicted SprT family Zn-dependent metalloprotease
MDLDAAESMALALMADHGLTGEGWRFAFDHAVRRFGVCRYQEKAIGLSRYLVELNPPERVRLTILHEIAHALVGPGHSHDRVWQMKALAIGSDGRRCYSEADTAAPAARYFLRCPTCNVKADRHRFGDKILWDGLCARCRGPLDWFDRKAGTKLVRDHERRLLLWERGPGALDIAS